MSNTFDKPFTLDRVVRLLISLAIVATSIYLIYVLRNVLLPFFIAWLIAYLLNPLVRFFQKRLYIKNRPLAVAVTLVTVIGLLTLLVIALIPTMEKEVHQINTLVSTYEFGNLKVEGLPLSVHDFLQQNLDFKALQNALSKETATETVHYMMPALQGIVSSTISAVLAIAVIFIIVLYLIFILIDYDKVNELWSLLIPPRYRNFVHKLMSDVEKSMNTYFRNQALICLIIAILYAIAFQIIGLPLALILGLLIGVLHMVPYLQAISIIPAVLLCWLKASQSDESFFALLGLTALVYIIMQCVVDLILVPKIMGKAMGLNPAVILLSLSVWGALLGIVGMIIAIPLTTLLLSYYQSFISSITPQDENELLEAESPKVSEE